MQPSRLLRYSGPGLLLAVLAAGPFLKGLFFWTELLASIGVVVGGFALWLVGRRMAGLPVQLSGGLPGLALLALLLCYVLQFPWAVYARGNLDWVLRAFAAWGIFVMIRSEAGPGLRRLLAWLMVLTAAGLAVHGFLEFTGYFIRDQEMRQALDVVHLGDRMYTALQYPNTAAAYFLASLIAAVGLAVDRMKAWAFTVMAGLMTLISLAFFFTVSRGAVVVLPFGLALLFLGLDNAKRWAGLLLLAAAWVPTLAVVKQVGDLAGSHAYGPAFGWIGVATVAGALAGLATSFFLRLSARVQGAAAAVVVLAAALALVAVRPGGSLLPKQASRLLGMNLNTPNVVYRIELDKDALKMVEDRPLGRGGWGWERSYRRYQEFYYVGQETHNHYLQTAAEAGIPGALALVIAMGTALWAAWRNRVEQPLAWSLAAGAGLIAGHSVIDFNLSYGAVWLLFWSLLAVAGHRAETERQNTPTWAASVAGAAVVAVVASVLTVASWYTDKAERLVKENQQEQAVAAARVAAKLDPLNSAPLLVIGGREALEQAARLDPYQTRPRWELAVLLQNQEDWEGALKAARATVQNHPMISMHYSKLATIAGSLMVDALHKGNMDRARELSRELLDLGDSFNRRKAVPEQQKGPWMGQKLAMAPDFQLRYGQALYLNGNTAAAEPLLKEAAKVGLLGSEAELWLYVLYEKRGDKKAMAPLENKAWIRFRNVNPVYKALRTWQSP